jgi:hypothetical protein
MELVHNKYSARPIDVQVCQCRQWFVSQNDAADLEQWRRQVLAVITTIGLEWPCGREFYMYNFC